MAVTDAGQAVVKIFKQLQSIREPLDTHYSQCYDYTYPSLGSGFYNASDDGFSNAQAAANKQAKLFDSTGTDATRLLASSVLSSLTPPYTRWFNLGRPNVTDESMDKDGAEYLTDVSEIIHTAIHGSNYDTESLEFILHMMIAGMAGLYVTVKERRLHFETWPINRLYCQETLGLGRIDTVYRQCFYTAREAVLEFGLSKLPDRMQEDYRRDEHSTKTYKFIHAIRPRIRSGKQSQGRVAKNMPWESIWVTESGEIVRESGFMEMPVIVPRWLKIPDTDYARGPVFDALPDLKTLNKVKEGMLVNMDMHTSGMWKVKDDGVINPANIVFGPRRIIPVGDMDNLQPLGQAGDVQFAVAQIQSLQGSIRKMLLADQLGPTEKSIQTATEVQTRNNQVRQILGPIFARLQSEFLSPLVERVYALMASENMLPPPPESLRNSVQELEYRSPLAKSQKQMELQSIDELLTRMTNLVQMKPEIMDLLDGDKVIAKNAELLGVDPEILRDPDEVKRIRKQRAAAQQAQAEAEQQQAAAQAAPPPTQG